MTIDNKIKILIGIGASIAAECEPCLEYHIKLASESGISDNEIKLAKKIGSLIKNKSCKSKESRTEKKIKEIIKGNCCSSNNNQVNECKPTDNKYCC